ncbi:MAG TPA: serine hydrolase [Bacteroidales bacterium]
MTLTQVKRLMMSPRLLKNKQKILLLLIAALSIGIAITPGFIFKGLLYREADIDDYKIFNNRTVKAGDYQPWQIDSAYNFIQLPEEFRKLILDRKTVAFLVIQDGKIKYEEYWDGYDSVSYSNSFSMAKGIVSLLVGVAIDEGFIKSVDQKVGDFLQSFRRSDKSEITVRDLLTMSSGLEWDEAYSSLFAPNTQMYYGNDLEKIVNSLELVSPPGKTFNYQSINSEVLAMVLETATGKTISEYASEKFWIPMGAQKDALWSLDKKDGLEKAFCCFNSNARDFARWGQLVLNHGNWNGKQLISQNYLREATSPASYLIDENGKPLNFYGFQYWIFYHNGDTIPYMRGILGQYVYSIPSKNAVVVRLGHERDREYIENYTKDVADYVQAAYFILNQ